MKFVLHINQQVENKNKFETLRLYTYIPQNISTHLMHFNHDVEKGHLKLSPHLSAVKKKQKKTHIRKVGQFVLIPNFFSRYRYSRFRKFSMSRFI